eukprot:2780213-Pyramimonas_sp.AAC.1
MVQGLLIFTGRHLGSAWGPRGSAFDACESGRATVEATADLEQITRIACWIERWRCKGWGRVEDPLVFQPRQRAL